MALYVMEDLDFTVSNDIVRGLWVKIEGKENEGDVIVGVSYRPPGQDDDTNE